MPIAVSWTPPRNSTAVISDNLSRLPGAVGLRPFHRGGTMVGRAFTVRTAGGDNLTIHRALDLVQPGNVLVGPGWVLKVTGFGLAKKVDEAGLTVDRFARFEVGQS